MLLSLVFIPLLAAGLVSAFGRQWTRQIATAATLLPVAAFAVLAAQFDWTRGGDYQFTGSHEWLPEFGLSISVGVDSVSMLLLGLTALLGPICVVGSFTAVTKRVRTYYFWLLVLQAAVSGVFMARDVILFYVFFEFTLVPMFVLISIYGSSNRKAAAIKFFLYTFTGSVIALAGLVYVAWSHATQTGGGGGEVGRWTFDLATLQAASAKMPLTTQMWVFGALMMGFAVKVPLFPFHTWLPLAHTEAPTAGSVVLAGVLLKLGTYGILVFAIPFCPRAAIELQTTVATLAVIGIIYGGLVCWVQNDVKKLVAYSSVAHLGFCMLGMFAFNPLGLQGSILYMVNHGLSTGALFLCIGMIYERYHTRSMRSLGGLAAKMPVWATFMIFFTMASVGLPGTNGFISEFLCLIGTFQAGDWTSATGGAGAGPVAGGMGRLGVWYAFLAGTGMIIAAIYLLYMAGKVVWGPLVEPHGHGSHGGGHAPAAHGATGQPVGHGPVGGAGGEEEAPVLPADLTAREIGVLIPLAALCLVLGIYPKPITQALEPAVARTAKIIDDTRLRHPTPAGTPAAAPVKATGGASGSDHTPVSAPATTATQSTPATSPGPSKPAGGHQP